MTKPCIVVNPDLRVEHVARLFADHGLLRAPVIQGELLGIISVSDILTKSKFIEHPLTFTLQQDLQDATQNANAICAEAGAGSRACAMAWNVVDALETELAHHRSQRIPKTIYEEYCEEFPEAMSAKMFDNLCSG
jgi:CBS-domain-containing membrane protein